MGMPGTRKPKPARSEDVMEAKAIAKFIRVSPRKTRIVAKNVVGRPVEDALNILKFTPQKGAEVIRAVMRSALANAEHNTGMNVDALIVKEILVNEGPTWKRFMPRAQGRATSIRKRTSHVTVILAENN
ncbi:50S ribosomal subunit protein L22 [uncultured delta proteobacterium]|uniref:Large ribosomal subunit protein uL22 n=1 Tax=uncultured delta proteobacterium TaxID=34034 RepID=A0A212KF24_9DELT|nr:50S ribosomal subunit protein L22 [uncultured delta proteobacterium]